MEQLFIRGIVEAIYFQNQSNFYKVMLIRIEETNADYQEDDIVVTGTFGQIHQESAYIFYGELTTHAKYGVQFQASSYKQEAISSEEGLILYLSSDKFKGIGKVLAERIVEVFGEQTIDCIIQKDDRLKKIQGLTEQKRLMLIDRVSELQQENQTILTLLSYGLSDAIAYRIFQLYRENAVQTIEEDPYVLLQTIDGLGFSKVDQLGEKLGFAFDARQRLRGGLYVTLRDVCYQTGYTYVRPVDLLSQTLQVLEKSRQEMIDEDKLAQELIEMIQTGFIIEDNERLSLPSLYYAEDGIVSSVKALLNQTIDVPVADLDSAIKKVEKKLNIAYSQAQKEAIKQAVYSPLSILTGGPGTGKTTVLNGIVSVLAQVYGIDLKRMSERDCPILLAAPTGRAAKRMKEMTGLQASTIHRLLGIGLTGETIEPSSEEATQELEGFFLIVDEMSMVDTWLMNWLLKSIPMGMQVLLVGDKYQLPSVGPGQVLHDLLACETIPSVELTQVYRQSEKSTLIPLAHEVKDGIFSEMFVKNSADRSFFECQANQVGVIVEKVVARAKEKGYATKDIQVLAPMYKGAAGINQLNTIIQSILNPNTDKTRREVSHFERVYRVGDKVLQLVNQPEKQVFNGDIGEIEAIFYADETEDKVETLLVSFDGIEVSYPRNEWNQLTLAYCCSIHKAQGSEFPLVILPMVSQYGRMIRRDLLYTAMTRSKKVLICCGEQQAFRQAVEKEVSARWTLLGEKLNTELLINRNDENENKLRINKQSSELSSRQQDNGLTDTMEDRSTNTKRETEETFTVAQKQDKKILNRVNSANQSVYLTEENLFLIDPMIGMNGISPADFMEVE